MTVAVEELLKRLPEFRLDGRRHLVAGHGPRPAQAADRLRLRSAARAQLLPPNSPLPAIGPARAALTLQRATCDGARIGTNLFRSHTKCRLERPGPRWFKGGKRRQPDHHRSRTSEETHMDLTRRSYLGGMGAAIGAGILPETAAAQAKSLPGLPSTMIWSVYDVGASGYIEASAVADALGKVYGTRVRLQPSGTSIGRIQPLKERRVSLRLARHGSVLRRRGSLRVRLADLGPAGSALPARSRQLDIGRHDQDERHQDAAGHEGQALRLCQGKHVGQREGRADLRSGRSELQGLQHHRVPELRRVAEGARGRQGRLRGRRAANGNAARTRSQPLRHQLDRAPRIRQGSMGEDPEGHPAGLADQRNVRRGPQCGEPEGDHGLPLSR